MQSKKYINFINSKELISFLSYWLNDKNNVVPFVHGKAGIGKTEITVTLGDNFEYKVIVMNLGNMEEGDLIGIPYKEDNVMKYSVPDWLYENKDKRCLLFLDELDRAPKNILNFALAIVREFRIHQHMIPLDWKICAAGNSGINDAFYDTNEMDFALKSRFVHLFYELTTIEWIEWASKNNISKHIIEYLKIYPQQLIVEPTNIDTFSYPNPRTWEILSNTLKFTPENLWKAVIIGSIGKEIGEAFFLYIKKLKRNSYPMSFSEFIVDKNKALKKLKEMEKNSIVDTINNISNNIKSLAKDTKKNIFIDIIANILGMLIYLELFELSIVLFSSIKELEGGNIINNNIINYMENNKKLNQLIKKHQYKLKEISKKI